ncbi:MAG: methylenetetrahydrofolate dehydrogenase [Candidatus Parcubacteria bacterium]|jgi:methylenetetrahydrofolate dehydrogenase (NADP+)/methenyltetrahydrofolate cyclohydrolase
MVLVTIDGKTIAAKLIAELKPNIAALKEPRFFGAVLVGENAASRNFLKQKAKVAEELGIDFRLYELPDTITTDNLRDEVGRLARPKNCGGFIVQLPLPEHLDNKHYVLNAIPKEKDVDLLSEAALGAFYTGRHIISPPSVAAVDQIFHEARITNLRDLTVAVIGAGVLIGRPVGFWMQNRVGELMVFDSSVKNLREKLRDADVVVSGAGAAGLFGTQHLKDGALVIDFGFNRTAEGRAIGDFDPTGAEERNISYTPTPGGTGPILVAKLYENFWKLNVM